MDAVSRHPAQESLAELLQRIRAGSPEAFDAFYERAAPWVMGLSRKMLADRMEAEDVCHDVLLTVIRHPERYDPSRGSVEAWLAVLTKSRCLDRLRKRRKTVLETAEFVTNRHMEPVEETERSVLAKMEREALRRALKELPGTQREALTAAFYDDRSHRELAERWEVPLGTVKSRVRYGLSHLRKAMVRLGWAEAKGGGPRG